MRNPVIKAFFGFHVGARNDLSVVVCGDVRGTCRILCNRIDVQSQLQQPFPHRNNFYLKVFGRNGLLVVVGYDERLPQRFECVQFDEG